MKYKRTKDGIITEILNGNENIDGIQTPSSAFKSDDWKTKHSISDIITQPELAFNNMTQKLELVQVKVGDPDTAENMWRIIELPLSEKKELVRNKRRQEYTTQLGSVTDQLDIFRKQMQLMKTKGIAIHAEMDDILTKAQQIKDANVMPS
ncbi:MAG: hypothetical protein ACUZ8H_15015, partial [Candidatus Anammoxibacter sp.]